MKPPLAKRFAFERSLHGEQWTDHYHWLRAEHWQDCIEDPEALPDDIKDYLLAENAWFDHQMADMKPLQAMLVSEMRGRIPDVDESLPDAVGPWRYIERYEQGDEYPRYYRYARSACARSAAVDRDSLQLLIDFNVQALQHEYFDPGDYTHSPDHRYLAWSADTQGAERYQAKLRNLELGVDEEVIDDMDSMTWGNAHTVFYTRIDDDLRPSRVYRHVLGTSVSNDVLVFEESDPRFYCSVWTSASEHYVFISSQMNDQSEVWFIPVADIEASPVVIEPRALGVEYSVEHQGERFLIHTNADNAADFKIVSAPCATPSRAHWTDWLAHRPSVMVIDLYACEHWVMWMERENALPRICYCKASKSSDHAHSLEFDQQAYALSLEPLVEFDTGVFRFSYESPSTPAQTYAFDMRNCQRRLLKQDILPSGHDANDYVVRRLAAKAKDGEWIPATVLHHRLTALDGSAACRLSAYGAYGDSEPAVFCSAILSLVDRHVICVLAHVRGGQEKGRAWYEAARGANKQNTFDDVAAVAQHLIDCRYISADKLVLTGGSAGGLMVGAVLNQYEGLFAGAIADVPFVDALNSLIDDSLPLTPGEWSQWGNPLDSHEAFQVIRRYSPYENVQARAYPPMLVTAGVSDPRVTYWESAKWVAQHRHLRSDDNLLLLRTNMSTGHFGSSGRFAALHDEAMKQAFVLKVAGFDGP